MLFLLILVFSLGSSQECRWMCDDPVCKAECFPACKPSRCQVQCLEGHTCTGVVPTCSTQPLNVLEQLPSENCPVAEVRCNALPASCSGCQPLCEPPECSWICRKPGVCRAPTCQLACERPACEYSSATVMSPGRVIIVALIGGIFLIL